MRLLPLLLALLLRAPSAGDERDSQPAPDTPEPGSREAIAAATTEPRFLSPWVADVPDHPRRCPRPPSTSATSWARPGELTRTDGDLRLLPRAGRGDAARAGSRSIGKSEEGREILLVFVGDEKACADLDRLRERHGRPGGSRGGPTRRRMERIVAAHQALLHAPRRPALDRDGQPRDAHGAGLPAGRLRGARSSAQIRDTARRADQPRGGAGRPRPRGGLVLPAPQGQDRLRQPAADLAARTGASTSSTTTTATASSASSP